MDYITQKMDIGRYNMLPILALLFTLSIGELIVDRRNQDLGTMPVNIDSDVTTLILSGNSITRVEEGDMQSLLQVEKLYLDYNGVNFISTNAFVNNEHLLLLNIVHHALTTLSTDVFGAWRSIEQLISSVGPNNMLPLILIHSPALMLLEINTNPIQNLTLGHLPSLKTLRAQWCGLTIFPDLSVAPALEDIRLGSNYFTQIPKSAVAGLNKLHTLHVPNCRIRYLPDLSHLVSLKKLIIVHNAMKSLSDLYHQPLISLLWAGNPLTCDKTLCWVRMCSFTRPALNMGNFPGEDVCEAPQERHGLRLMDIHPVEMECYEGNLMISAYRQVSNIRHTLLGN